MKFALVVLVMSFFISKRFKMKFVLLLLLTSLLALDLAWS